MCAFVGYLSPEHLGGSDKKQLLQKRQHLVLPGSQASKSNTSLSSSTKLSLRVPVTHCSLWHQMEVEVSAVPPSGPLRKGALGSAACTAQACTFQLLLPVSSRSFPWTILPRQSVFNGLKAQRGAQKSLSRPQSVEEVTQTVCLSFLAPSSPKLQTKTNKLHF